MARLKVHAFEPRAFGLLKKGLFFSFFFFLFFFGLLKRGLYKILTLTPLDAKPNVKALNYYLKASRRM